MRTIHDIKLEEASKVDSLLKECKMFFAFSDEQFMKNKTELKEGEKYVHVGHGGYMPKGFVETYISGMESISKWKKSEIKKNKQAEADIVETLKDCECFYTHDIEDAVDRLPYSREQIWKVFKKNLAKEIQS